MATLLSKKPLVVIVIKGSNLFLQSASGEDFFKGDVDGAVELYYDDTKKFETTGAGVAN